MRFTQVSNSRNKEIHTDLEGLGFSFFPMCGTIPSLTVNKHQSTGKPLNKGISVLLFNLECCMELSFQ